MRLTSQHPNSWVSDTSRWRRALGTAYALAELAPERQAAPLADRWLGRRHMWPSGAGGFAVGTKSCAKPLQLTGAPGCCTTPLYFSSSLS
jgi:hypothetical protein